ncbi:MAG: PQQ-binding-like beta-propeller repeat protein [Chloroflexi bacterium]|nr:PQQ-binding-like beta-propeller repeat protein [Chloroflexota bacterium]
MITGGRLLVLVVLSVLVVTGCTSQGTVNPGWTVVAVNGDNVYTVLASGTVLALKADSGTELWKYPVAQAASGGLGSLFAPKQTSQDTALNAVYGLPVFTDDFVVVGTFDNKLYAFNRTSGQKAWEYIAQGAIVGGPAEYDGTIYFGASDSRVYAVKATATSAELLWNPLVTTHGIWGAPVVDEKHVYVASLDHFIYALERQTGELAWKYDLGAAAPGGVYLAGDMVLVGGVSNKLNALSAATGELVWERQFDQWVWGEVLLDKGVLYASSLDGQVHALNPQDGTLIWDAKLDGATRAGPSLAGDYLVIGTNDGKIYRIGLADGRAELLYVIDKASILSKIAVLDNQVFAGTTSGTIVALDVTKIGGTPLWTYPTATK